MSSFLSTLRWLFIRDESCRPSVTRPCQRALRFELCERRDLLATYTVNTNIDTNVFDDTDNIVSIREALFNANQNPDPDTIDFSIDPAHGSTAARSR